MKTSILALSALALIFTLVSCGKQQNHVGHTEAAKPKLAADYPLDVCVVSGEKLSSMGDIYIIDYKGQQVGLCCDGCVKDFNADPEKYIKLINEAKAKKTAAATPTTPAEPAK